MFNFVEWHAALLNDRPRLAAYERAIAATVRPGDVVVDLGAGTGVMGLLACRAGASRVYALEGDGIIEMARRIAAANGFGDRIVAIYGDSRHVDLPEGADVAIADQIGPLGIGGGLFSVFNDARRRLLKPGGITIPARVALSVALAEHPHRLTPIEFWETPHLGFDMTAMCDVARNVGYETRVGAAELLSAPAQVLAFEPAQSCVEPSAGSATLRAARAGVAHGLFGFFSAELSPGVTVSNSPLGADTIDRYAWFRPFERPTALEAGDSAAVTLHVMPVEETVTWRAEINSRDGACKARFAHSTLKGKPVAREALRPLRPDYVPRLSPRGVIERVVLDLCDGARGVCQIAQELTRRFPGRFSGAEEAELAVLRVVGSRAE